MQSSRSSAPSAPSASSAPSQPSQPIPFQGIKGHGIRSHAERWVFCPARKAAPPWRGDRPCPLGKATAADQTCMAKANA
eukprot:10045061-Alexandrium_andersonii.AAC.1